MNLKSRVGIKSRMLLVLLILCSASAFANVTFTMNGTFGPSVGTTAFTAPNGAWTMTFQVANPPAAQGVPNVSFSTVYSNAVYTLNGVSIPLTNTSLTVTNNGFVNAVNAFMDTGLLGYTTQFVVYTGVPVYTGSNSNPSFILGSYPSTGSYVYIGSPANFATSSNLVISQTAPASTPAPSSVILVSIGLAALALIEILRRKYAAA